MPQLTAIVNPVNYGLGQDPSATNNYVTISEIEYFADMAIRELCKYAQAYPVVAKIALSTAVNSYFIPSTSGSAAVKKADDLSTNVDVEIGTIRDVVLVTGAISTFKETGESLRRIDQATVGQQFGLGGTTDLPIFYTTHGAKLLMVYPCTFASGTYNLLVYYDGIVTTDVDLDTVPSCPLDEDWYHLIVLYCIAKGKEKYQQYEQAKYYMDLFRAGLGDDANALKPDVEGLHKQK